MSKIREKLRGFIGTKNPLKEFSGNLELITIPEIERVESMAEKLKIIVDENDKVKVYANGVELKGIRKIEFEKEEGEAANVSIDWMTRNLPPFR